MTLPATFTPELLNRLFREHEKTEITERSIWLGNELRTLGLGDYQRELEGEFASVLGSSYVFLDGYPGGAKNSDQLWVENDAEILKCCPWLDEQNYAWAKHQSRYYAWHDGLVKD
jgi:hypothetical protein